MSSEHKPMYLFFSYAHEDRYLRDKLEDHLSNLKYRGLITTWHNREINAGDESVRQIDIHLNSADIILLLISANFMASEYCYSIEMQRALERQQVGKTIVIPILLRPVVYIDSPFASLQCLPKNGKPVVKWRDRDSAFVDIALGIEWLVRKPDVATLEFNMPGQRAEERQKKRERQEYHREGLLTYEEEYYWEALLAYDQALRDNPYDATAHRGKGNVLYALGHFDEALLAFEQAVSNNPTATSYFNIGSALLKIHKYEEALVNYKKAIELDPTFAPAYYDMGDVLKQLGRVEEAQQAAEKAEHLGY